MNVAPEMNDAPTFLAGARDGPVLSCIPAKTNVALQRVLEAKNELSQHLLHMGGGVLLWP